MRRIIVASVLLVFTAPAFAQDAKPNTLTPKEIGDGWILLFDGETTFGWRVRGPARIDNGTWIIGGDTEASIETTTYFGDGIVGYQYQQRGDKNEARIKFRGYKGGFLNTDIVRWQEERLAVGDGQIRNYVIKGQPGADVGSVIHAGKPDSKPSTISLSVPPGSQLVLRNVTFSLKKTESLFTGKDLSGWTIFPGKKSEFAVIDGAINIKNGPGDLQTEKKFGDFCLQFDCISQGEHLNSGVFFRCRPGEYQNGYEAQVRNQFTEKPTQKYLLEEYDPTTHKLLGKKEALFTAVDFGTGAIYRRQPARKQMSKDKEWFTMTVVAHGNHFATWVNGIQVTDWYDHRPPSDNARTGYRAEPGHLSLQGHDPTTNLSFKNFRIQEYLAPK